VEGTLCTSGKRHTKTGCEGAGRGSVGWERRGLARCHLGAPPSLQHQRHNLQTTELLDLLRSQQLKLGRSQDVQPGSSTSGTWRMGEAHLSTTRSASQPCISLALSPTAMPVNSLLPPRNKRKGAKDGFSSRFTCQRRGLEPEHLLLPPQVGQNQQRGRKPRPTLAPAQRRRALRKRADRLCQKPTHESRRCFYFLGRLEPRALFPLRRERAQGADPGSPSSMPGSPLAEPDVLGSTLGGEARGFRAETNNLHQTPSTPAPENLGFDQSALHLLPCPAESKQF